MYKRHARGGRFDRQDPGDGGLGQYKAQQDQIIENLKLQQLRTDQYSKELISGMRGVASSEQENRNLLNNLENRIYENKRSNIKLRGQREIENLEGKAKEYEKSSKFWKDFSTTYAKQYGQAAQGIADVVQNAQADAQMQKWLEDGTFDKLAEFGEKAQDIAGKDIQKEIAKSWKNGDVEGVHLGHNILKSSNRFLTKKVWAKLKEDHDAHWGAFKDFINNNPELEWSEDTIPQLAQFRARQLIKEFRLENSKAGRELYNFWTSKGEAEARNIREIKNGQEGNVERATWSNHAGIMKTPIARQQALQMYTTTGKTNAKGEFVQASNNGRIALGELGDDMVQYYPLDREGYADDMINTPFAGGVLLPNGKWSNGTFATRYKGQALKDLREEFLQKWDKMHKENLEKEKATLLAEGKAKLTELKNRLTDKNHPEYIDIATIEGWEESVNLLETYKPYSELETGANPHKELTSRLKLKPGTVNIESVDGEISRAAVANDADDFARLWGLLDAEGRKRHASNHKNLQALINGGGDFKSIEKRAKDAVKEQSGIATLDEKTHPTGVRIAKILQQGFNHEYNKLSRDKYEGKVPNWEVQMVEDAWAAAVKDFDAEKGLYKSTESAAEGGGSKRVYHFGLPVKDRNTTLEVKQIRALPYQENTPFKDLVLPDNLISENQTGYLANAIQSKRAVIIPEGLTLYAQLQGRPVTEVTNQWLKSKGYSQQLDYNYHDYAMLKSERLQLDIKNLDPWSGIAVTEYGSVIKENPEFKLNLMTPEVRKVYQQMRGAI